MKRFFRKRFIIPIAILGVFFSGPRADFPPIAPNIKALDIPLESLDNFVADKESQIAKLRPDNHARIVWADSVRKTPYSLVYIHGWSASPLEGDPIHFDFAKRYGCNMYLARLAGHGIGDVESFKTITPKDLVDSAKEAIAIGKLLGEKVIVMSCSTGSTLSIYLAAENPEWTDALIMYSPNINIENPMAAMFTWPWGLPILRKVFNGNYRSIEMPPETHQFWTITYRLEGLVCLKSLINQTMTGSTFQKISQPFLAGYYYKNEEVYDRVISIDAIGQFYDATTTPKSEKRKVAFPNVDTHCVNNHFQSKDLDDVRQKTWQFAEEVLQMSKE